MAPLRNLFAASALASLAWASPTQPSACAQVSASWASQASATATPTVPAKLAYDCITSVPFNQTAAVALLDAIRPYLQWQSNTAYLKNPPAEYAEKVQPAVDVLGGFNDITKRAKAGKFKSEYEFGWSLYTLLQSTHDGHFVFIPDSVGGIFNFGRPVALVSVSEDGSSLPVPYVYTDVLAESLGNTNFKASPVTKINGEDAIKYLENWAQYGSLQDRDALYNAVFYQLAQISLGTSGGAMGTFTGGGRGRWVYPGPITKLTFANKTSITFDNFARVLTSFTGINSGEDLYRLKFSTSGNSANSIGDLLPNSTASATATAVASSTTTVTLPTGTAAPGYPSPVVRHQNNIIGGYYIDEPGYEDIAVLSVPSFGQGSSNFTFPDVARAFLAEASRAGKTRLVIDVSANGGGVILQGYDLFKQLFPFVDAFAAPDQFRAIEALDILGEKYSQISGTVPRTMDQTNETLAIINGDIVSSLLNYRTDQTPDGKPFPSWDAKFGPRTYHGDKYSSLFRWNLSDILTPYNSGGFYVTGYEPVPINHTQPFAAENITVMTDGYCASTCTIFSELMRQLVGVKYVSMGGRKKSGLTQAIGGVKGTNNWPWAYIQYVVQDAFNYGTPEEIAYYSTTDLANYFNDLPFERAAAGTSINVNFRDGIRKGDETNTPLHFVYEDSDCRILYTKEMTVDVTAQWKAVVDSAWGSDNACVAGSLSGESSTQYRSRRAPIQPGSQNLMKRTLDATAYPLNIFTDLSSITFTDNGWMMP